MYKEEGEGEGKSKGEGEGEGEKERETHKVMFPKAKTDIMTVSLSTFIAFFSSTASSD